MNVKKPKLYFFLFIYQILNLDLSQASLAIKSSKNCMINSYKKIYIPAKTSDKALKKSIKKTSCPKKINIMFLNLIKDAQGAFSTKNFQKLYLPKNLNIKVEIKPSQIEISNFRSLINDIKLPVNLSFGVIKERNELSILKLDEEDRINISCPNCNTPGNKVISIKVKSINENKEYSTHFNIKLLAKTEIITPKKNIDYFNNKRLFKNDFSKASIKTIYPGKYFKNFDKIIFFKPIKTLKKGVPLLKRNLVPVKLVRSFAPVKIILSNKGIKLSGIAIAKKGGHYGEVIPLKNKKGKRIIFGKIIDFNKVKIEI